MRFLLNQSKSQLCIQLNYDVLDFCVKNPFRFSQGLKFLVFQNHNLSSFDFLGRMSRSSNLFQKIDFKLKKISKKALNYFSNTFNFKKRVRIYFKLATVKQLIFLFTNIFVKQSGQLLDRLLIQLELRLDFFIYRLGYAVDFLKARLFIKQGIFLVNNILVSNIFFILSIGDVIKPLIKIKAKFYKNLYLKWFNEFMLANNLLRVNFNFFYQKLNLLKLFKKKLKFYLLFKLKIPFNLNSVIFNFFREHLHSVQSFFNYEKSFEYFKVNFTKLKQLLRIKLQKLIILIYNNSVSFVSNFIKIKQNFYFYFFFIFIVFLFFFK